LVWDITNLSEICVDDIRVEAVTALASARLVLSSLLRLGPFARRRKLTTR
jgi:hypothetical protein